MPEKFETHRILSREHPTKLNNYNCRARRRPANYEQAKQHADYCLNPSLRAVLAWKIGQANSKYSLISFLYLCLKRGLRNWDSLPSKS